MAIVKIITVKGMYKNGKQESYTLNVHADPILIEKEFPTLTQKECKLMTQSIANGD